LCARFNWQNGTVQRAAADDLTITRTATTAAPLQPMVRRVPGLEGEGALDLLSLHEI
tara:strand:- start:1008 stop:1178 length:171 start_codon:yes stop_codon:yes gene_type:complete